MAKAASRKRKSVTPVLQFRSAQDTIDALQSQNSEIRAAASHVLERMQFLRQAGITFGGARDLYEIFGYDRLITTRQYRDRYARGGIAGRIIDAFPNATWRGEMEVVEDKDPKKNTRFEQDWQDLSVRHQLIAKLCRADKLSQLSTYSVLLIGAPGKLYTPLPKGKPGQLLFFTPFSGGGGPGGDTRSRAAAIDTDCSIMEFDTDITSPRFGSPLTYQLRRTDVSSPALQRQVHWSRILHIAEGVLDNEVYGQPSLERVWNLLDDLDKVTGGGAEAFFLRANQGLHLDIDKDMALPDAKNAVAALKEQSEEYKHQLTRWLRTRGVKVETLGSDVANFNSPADAVLTQIAGAKGIPKRILVGSEMGELASTQDRDNWKDQVRGRQTGYVGPYIVRPLVDRLIQYGYLTAPKEGPTAYDVVWPYIQTLTEPEKSAGAKQWADTNSVLVAAGLPPAYTDDEIRDKWYGLAPLTPIQKVVAVPPAVKIEAVTNEPTAAEEAEMLRVLEAAIASGDTAVIDRTLGVERPEPKPKVRTQKVIYEEIDGVQRPVGMIEETK